MHRDDVRHGHDGGWDPGFHHRVATQAAAPQRRGGQHNYGSGHRPFNGPFRAEEGAGPGTTRGDAARAKYAAGREAGARDGGPGDQGTTTSYLSGTEAPNAHPDAARFGRSNPTGTGAYAYPMATRYTGSDATPSGAEGTAAHAAHGHGRYARPTRGGPVAGAAPEHRTSMRGRGPRNYVRSDELILDELVGHLVEAAELDISDVEVDCAHGELRLSGTVPVRWMKHRIEDVAHAVRGAREVHNRIRVQARGQDGTRA